MVTDRKHEIEQFVSKFKDEFRLKFGYNPYVIYKYKEKEEISHTLNIGFVTSAAELILQIHLRAIKKEGSYSIFNKTKRCRESIDHRHASYKILFDMGYSIFDIANHFDTKEGTIVHGINKIQNFLRIKDPTITKIIENIENVIKENSNGTLDSF